MKNQKCQSVDGPTMCGREDCPERSAFIDQLPSSFKTLAKLPNKKVEPGSWSNTDTVLLKTIHGSKLYGLSHADSDDDFYVVSPTKYVVRQIRREEKRTKASQTIIGNDDTTYVDFATFDRMCKLGVPQALEAMYSRENESEFFQSYRDTYFCSDPTVIHTYMKTIKSFSMTEKLPFKRRRHALRLALNMEEMLYTGRFNPRLSAENISRITRYAEMPADQYFTNLEAMSLIEVDWGTDFRAKHVN